MSNSMYSTTAAAMPVNTILAVDDDPDILDIICEVLGDQGYHVEKANTVKEGEANLAKHPPSLILLDLHLPDRSGSHLARKVKSSTHTQHIPVVLFSSHNELENTAEDVAADSYLHKPFDLEKLVEVVGALIVQQTDKV